MFNVDYYDNAIIEKINNKFFSLDEKQIIEKYIDIENKEFIKYLELELLKYDKETNFKVKKIKFFKDTFGNPMIFVEYLPIGWAVFSLTNFESLVININEKSNKISKLDKTKIYSFGLYQGNFFEIKKEYDFVDGNELYTKLINNKLKISDTLNNKKLIEVKNKLTSDTNNMHPLTLGHSPGYAPLNNRITDRIIKADKEVSHSWWFKTLNDNFGYAYPPEDFNYTKDDRGLCHYIAIALLLEYGQLFLSQETFSQNQLEKYMTKPTTSNPLNDKYGYPTGPKFNKKLTFDLWFNHGKEAFFTSSSYLVSVMNSFQYEDKHKYPLYVQRRSAGWIKPWKWINDDKPCIVFGHIPVAENELGWHAIVVYGYFDNGNKCLAHFGWEGYSQVIMSSSLSGQLWLLGVSASNGKPTVADKSYFMLNNENVDVTRFK
ncbi:Hypothetical protein MAU_2600 [Metamycoplasma auris 15026]|uniref:Uncharacterized protein n=1 Tax=Metamycoplasma auris 15026 TaxID=1188233 RepID=N9TS36_9BACT|nr:hypothetical protein [Metamycoplasma auris]ENY68890.1 Hypothetical protein MAU_2600 [Metamycoplasma auris 15026]